jgi:putative addiction module component (TIGR02574 family)
MISTSEIASLPIEERLKLVDFIWDTILHDPVGPPVTEALGRELDRRLAHAEKNPNDESSWEEVEARIRAKL